MDLTLTLTKDQLIKRLEQVIPLCKAQDQKIRRDHKAEEVANWKKWKKDCAEWNRRQQALTLDGYKKLGFGPNRPNYTKVRCPESVTDLAKRYLADVKVNGQSRYTISPSSGRYWRLYQILTIDAPRVKDVC